MAEVSSISQHAPDEQQEYSFNKSLDHRRPDVNYLNLVWDSSFAELLPLLNSFITSAKEVTLVRLATETAEEMATVAASGTGSDWHNRSHLW